MSNASTKSASQSIQSALSASRLSTYEQGAETTGDPLLAALQLYDWNAQVSGAFMMPLHICEVVMRNAVAEALEGVYGDRWPWSQTFETSLPSPTGGYDPRKDLQNSSKRQDSVGKVIPELKFVFWQKMFTGRYDDRIWNKYLREVLPNTESNRSVTEARQYIYAQLEQVRQLRNRVAHHEPIFARDLARDLATSLALIELRCIVTAAWATRNQKVTALLLVRPG